MQSTEEAEKAAASRPAYRAGRRPRAVRVYTINQESRYLVVENVPALNLAEELLHLFEGYGCIDEYRLLDDHPTEDHMDVYWIRYTNLKGARQAKRQLDDYLFFHQPLRIRYGPEYESVDEVRAKLAERQAEAMAVSTTSTENISNDQPLQDKPAISSYDSSEANNTNDIDVNPAITVDPLPDPILSATTMVRHRMEQATSRGDDNHTAAAKPSVKKQRRRI